jgi:hypothetical protein
MIEGPLDSIAHYYTKRAIVSASAHTLIASIVLWFYL